MNNQEVISQIVRSAHSLLIEEQTMPMTKYNPYLVDILHLCINNKELMGQIPDYDAEGVGIAFLHILNLTDESNSQVYPTYSSISFYYLQKYLNQGKDIVPDSEYARALNRLIILMNIGAQSFCRTIARAYHQTPDNFIDFNDWMHLPSYVKKVLLLELGYFVELDKTYQSNSSFGAFGVGMSQELSMRYNFLKNLIPNRYFYGINTIKEATSEAEEVKVVVYDYVSGKIGRGDIYFL